MDEILILGAWWEKVVDCGQKHLIRLTENKTTQFEINLEHLWSSLEPTNDRSTTSRGSCCQRDCVRE